MNEIHTNFFEKVLREKECLILLCIKDVAQTNKAELGKLYEVGIFVLYYVYKFYCCKKLNHQNFDYLAFQLIKNRMLDYIRNDVNT